MNNKRYLYKIIILIAISLLFQSCLKDNVTAPVNITLTNASLLLKYLEDQGDYINSGNMPSIVNVDEVQNNLKSYLILDIRAKTDYSNGHIPGAINIASDSLITYLTVKNNNNSFPKVVIVSAAGHSSAYFTCLLRLYGFNNVYSLNFGMAEWNPAFSAVWTSNIGNCLGLKSFDNVRYPKAPKTPLPDIQFKFPDSTVQINAKERIVNLINDGFTDKKEYVRVDPKSITANVGGEDPMYFYIACYGTDWVYLEDKLNTLGSGHFQNAARYAPHTDLRSTTNLQTFPSNKRIVVYSTSGQQSAFVAAYLRLLGYDAKTLLFGASNLSYYILLNRTQWLAPFLFIQNNIRNYSYITGSSPN